MHPPGQVFTSRMTKREAAIYDLDHHKRYRLLMKLKEDQQEKIDENPSTPVSSTSQLMSQSQPTPSNPDPSSTDDRGDGKNGLWKGDSTEKMLRVCFPYRKWLRPIRYVSEEMYSLVASELTAQFHWNFSASKIREKLRNLRRTFKNNKKGKGSGERWEHFWAMTYIYDEPIQEGDVTLAPIGFEPPVSAPVNPSIGLNLSDGLAYLSQNASSSAAQQTSFPCSVPEFTGPSATLALPSSSCSPPASNGFLNLLSSSVNVFDNNNNNDLGWECSDLSTWDEKEALSSTQLPRLSSLANCQVQHGQLKSNDFEEVENDITLLNMSDEEEADCSEHLTDVSDNLMSPAKKKAQKDDGSLQVTQNTPRKTPRKQKPCGGKSPSSPRNIAGNRRTPRRNLCSQNELDWPPARIKLLLAECLIRKDKVQQEHIPVATWKEISKALKDSGETVSWEVCRGKFCSLSDYFAERLLNTRGVVGGVKVPYYELLCQIYDVPVNFEMPQEVTAQTSSSNKLWDAASISFLLSLYRARQDAFNGTKSCVRHTTLFKEISAAMLPFKNV